MSEEHWLVKPAGAMQLLAMDTRQLEEISLRLAYTVAPGGGVRLFLREYLEELVQFIEAGNWETDAFQEFFRTTKARKIGQLGYQRLLAMLQHAAIGSIITAQSLAEIFGLSEGLVLQWNRQGIPRSKPIQGRGNNPLVTYPLDTVLRNLYWYGPGMTEF
jgi:hypothetical protein